MGTNISLHKVSLTLWMANEFVPAIEMEDKLLSACDKTSFTLALMSPGLHSHAFRMYMYTIFHSKFVNGSIAFNAASSCLGESLHATAAASH